MDCIGISAASGRRSLSSVLGRCRANRVGLLGDLDLDHVHARRAKELPYFDIVDQAIAIPGAQARRCARRGTASLFRIGVRRAEWR